jgi:hypothetical protein
MKAGQAARQPPALGITRPHPIIAALWDCLSDSTEARFYSVADWQRCRSELHYGNRLLRGRNKPPAAAWSQFQKGLAALLVSPAEKRRCGVELEPPDPGEDEAVVLQIARYQESLKSE